MRPRARWYKVAFFAGGGGVGALTISHRTVAVRQLTIPRGRCTVSTAAITGGGGYNQCLCFKSIGIIVDAAIDYCIMTGCVLAVIHILYISKYYNIDSCYFVLLCWHTTACYSLECS